MYKTILYSEVANIATITLNRPKKKNAMNDVMINELIDVFEQLELNDDIRVITITGEGDTFCSGADLNWLSEVKDFSYKQNYNESLKLVKLLKLVHEHYKPVICKVNGPAVGGGVGLMLASDIVIASEDSFFGLSEVAIGIIPAAIIPFLMSRMSESKAREYLITGHRLDAKEAERLNLINYYVKNNEIDEFTDQIVKRIKNNGMIAVSKVKEMVNTFSATKLDDDNMEYIANIIAKLRTSEEGQEGISAFLEKRKPNWVE
ncbi:MAG: enoyl-CoA hydratase [Ignavibacteriae bacterium HGW-Ignavibacteriae-4]|jgi:methylglutaconyl-CoA hydratase|nr:MAG: enoyl-CoA hydratase [Ignavibacteriae bacterium HGW-Ignavibacteriae-4]